MSNGYEIFFEISYSIYSIGLESSQKFKKVKKEIKRNFVQYHNPRESISDFIIIFRIAKVIKFPLVLKL